MQMAAKESEFASRIGDMNATISHLRGDLDASHSQAASLQQQLVDATKVVRL